ncbi:MarR family transcriptional regulator [Paramagnetospirillum kuznetsovii]|uniref:MarR family transcriptional regulator n=1 Tax=Paramagnetospirillum kuznetsovii TaxID=2053833 RepID=A0A364P2H2_9PROT|nr:winged helix-turn-helix transcriptional regulator [Paramagnetospirillum kuznetsovii]RAU23542.1 MarR family transcriptional regulator [Paramagnetospirillum kuznetsovii]
MSRQARLELDLLKLIHADANVTQRKLAGELGIALGLANSYLKRCVKKGLVKVMAVPANRYAYFLTPQGFAEKSRLVGEYLSQSLNFFRQARGQCEELFQLCEKRGWRRVALCGASDLADIAALTAADFDIVIVGIASLAHMDQLGEVDAVLLTDLADPLAAWEALVARMPAERVLTPKILEVAP